MAPTPVRVAAILLGSATPSFADNIHFGNGIKIGEVDAALAIVWTRPANAPERHTDGVAGQADEDKVTAGRTLADMTDGLMDTQGTVRAGGHGKDGAEQKKSLIGAMRASDAGGISMDQRENNTAHVTLCHSDAHEAAVHEKSFYPC